MKARHINDSRLYDLRIDGPAFSVGNNIHYQVSSMYKKEEFHGINDIRESLLSYSGDRSISYSKRDDTSYGCYLKEYIDLHSPSEIGKILKCIVAGVIVLRDSDNVDDYDESYDDIFNDVQVNPLEGMCSADLEKYYNAIDGISMYDLFTVENIIMCSRHISEFDFLELIDIADVINLSYGCKLDAVEFVRSKDPIGFVYDLLNPIVTYYKRNVCETANVEMTMYAETTLNRKDNRGRVQVVY